MSGQSPDSVTSNGITPLQQMVSSCSGALLTSLFGDTLFIIFGINCTLYTFEQTSHATCSLYLYLIY